eukprot:gene9113-9282_t
MALPVSDILWKDYVEEGRVTADDFLVTTDAAGVNPGELKEGQILVELLYLSVDPYMRGRMRNTKGYFIGPFEPGKPVTGGGLGLVKASKAADFAQGDVISGLVPWSSFFVLDVQQQGGMLQKIDKSLLGKVPLSYFLGAMGMPGLTAYAGIKKIAEPKQGEVAFVSAAAGAVGMVAGQLLKQVYGCKVIGSAGSDDKVAALRDLGFDYVFNYKTTSTGTALAEAAPDGIDIYFENVGGQTLEVAIDHCRDFARIVACGMISQYDMPDEKKYGVKNLFMVVTKRLKMQGYIVSDYSAELGAEFATNMAEYVQQGKVKVTEHVTEGLENAGAAFVDMMAGGNLGKAIVKVVQEDPFPVTP